MRTRTQSETLYYWLVTLLVVPGQAAEIFNFLPTCRPRTAWSSLPELSFHGKCPILSGIESTYVLQSGKDELVVLLQQLHLGLELFVVMTYLCDLSFQFIVLVVLDLVWYLHHHRFDFFQLISHIRKILFLFRGYRSWSTCANTSL